MLSKSERREYSRIRVKAPLHYQLVGAHEFNTAMSQDISMGGVGFINHKFVAPSTLVMLEIDLLSRILRPTGKIAWASPLPHSYRHKLGVEFLEFDPLEKKYLADFIEMKTGPS